MNGINSGFGIPPDMNARAKLIPTKNNLPKPTRREMIELLNQQLADAIDLGLQAKESHCSS